MQLFASFYPPINVGPMAVAGWAIGVGEIPMVLTLAVAFPPTFASLQQHHPQGVFLLPVLLEVAEVLAFGPAVHPEMVVLAL